VSISLEICDLDCGCHSYNIHLLGSFKTRGMNGGSQVVLIVSGEQLGIVSI